MLGKYETAYAVRAVRPFGQDGVEQRIGCVYGLSQGLNLSAVAATVLEADRSNALGSAQVELMADLFSTGDKALQIAAGGGFLREYQGTNTLLARAAAGLTLGKWKVDSNMLLEKPFGENRDAVDVLFSLGTSRQLHRRVSVGIEALGEDLEGFVEEEEAEGGAKLLLTPTLHYQLNERMKVRFGAGPIFYMTHSEAISDAPRMLPSNPGSTGFMTRLSALYLF